MKAFEEGDFSPSDLLDHHLAEIDRDKKKDRPFHAVVYADEKKAKERLKDAPRNALLTGIPILIKDNMSYRGHPVECASNILKGYLSPYTGGACEQAENHGAVIFGRTNMDEFAMGSSTENSARGVTRNPINPLYTPGGSSGGAAAAVALGHALCALGSDTGGSIRQPAALCGVVGLKPTYGRVSRYGLVAFASSLDQIGPLTRTVEDAALVLRCIAGQDPRDVTSSDHPVPDYTAGLNHSSREKKIGLPKEYFGENLHPAVRKNVGKVVAFYREQGYEMVDISLPHTEYALGTYHIIATAEASANLARFDGVHYQRRAKKADNLDQLYLASRSEGFGQEVKRRVLLGVFVLSAGYYDAYYGKAQRVRRVIKEDFDCAFEKVDAIITPTVPDPAFKLGERLKDPLKMYLADIYTTPTSLAGLPAISIPCGCDSEGLPVAFQLIAPHFGEEIILNLGHLYQKENSPYFE